MKFLITILFLLVFWLGCYNIHTQFIVYIKGSFLNTSKNCSLHNLHIFNRAEEKLDINISADETVCRLLVKNIAVTALSV